MCGGVFNGSAGIKLSGCIPSIGIKNTVKEKKSPKIRAVKIFSSLNNGIKLVL